MAVIHVSLFKWPLKRKIVGSMPRTKLCECERRSGCHILRCHGKPVCAHHQPSTTMWHELINFAYTSMHQYAVRLEQRNIRDTQKFPIVARSNWKKLRRCSPTHTNTNEQGNVHETVVRWVACPLRLIIFSGTRTGHNVRPLPSLLSQPPSLEL